MSRQTDDERAERRRRAGRCLRGWRDGARIRQSDMAEMLGVAQQTYSQYERGLVQIPYELAPKIAEILHMDEPDVWRGLEFPLPAQWRTNDALKRWMYDNWGDIAAEVLGTDPGPNAPGPGRNGTTRPPTGETRSEDDNGRENAV